MANIIELDTRLGKKQLDSNKIITFPDGIIGYPDEHQFSILPIGEASPFMILQSIITPSLGLLVGDPYAFISDYTVRMNDAEQKILQSEEGENLLVLITVNVPHGTPELTKLNLTGPIFINTETQFGLQIPQDITPSSILLSECLAVLQDS